MSQNEAEYRAEGPTASSREALEALRREIDTLDDAMLSLVEKRVAAAMGIAEAKRNDGTDRLRLRPAREAAVVDRLASKAIISPQGLVRQVWQEIMACCLNLQVPNELVLHATGQPALLTDAMRRRFGCAASLSVATSPEEALRAAREREAVAVIELEPDSDWWIALREEPGLAMFDCLRSEDGVILGVAIGRIAPEDLAACPAFRIADDADSAPGTLLAEGGGLRLLVEDRP